MNVEQPVSTLFKLYLERSDLRPASIEFKQRACALFIEWFGDLPVGGVLPATAQSYRAMLSKTGRSPQGRSQTSVRGYLDNFRPFWKWLRDNRYIDADPFQGIEVKVDEGQPKEPFTATEIGLMMLIAKPLERLQICLGLLGCRRGEMFNTQLRDIHLDDKRPYIELVGKRASDKTWPWGTKSHHRGMIALPETMQFETITVNLHDLIRKQMLRLSMEPQGYLCVPTKYAVQLLELQAHRQLTWERIKDPTGNFSRHFRMLQKRAGIRQPKRFHELRAFFITVMFDANVSPARIAKSVRHANIKTTMGYDRKSERSLVEDVAQIAARAYAS